MTLKPSYGTANLLPATSISPENAHVCAAFVSKPGMAKGRGYSLTSRSTMHALCPPNPNEFETAILTSASRASFGM